MSLCRLWLGLFAAAAIAAVPQAQARLDIVTGATVESEDRGDTGGGVDNEDIDVSEDSEADAPGDDDARRDPFRPFIVRRPQAGDEPVGGLAKYELKQLVLVGVLLDMVPPRALIEDSSGMGFVVTPGMPIGRRGGVVAAIEDGRMVVEEKSVDFYGHEKVSRKVLEIPEDDETKGGRE